MLHRIAAALLLAFLAAIGVNWPDLPFNARLADLLFLPLALVVLAVGGRALTWRRADTAVALYLLGAVPAIAISTDLRHSTIEFVREIYLVAIYAIIAIAARSGLAKTIAAGLALAGALLSIAGLFFFALSAILGPSWPRMGEVMMLPYVGAVLRLRALTASEAMFACLLTAAVPFAVASADRHRRWWQVTMMVAAALLTFSHAVAGFAVSLVMATWHLMSRWQRRVAVAATVVIALGLNFAATVSIKSVGYLESNYADASQYHYAIEEGHVQIGAASITYNVMSYARIKQVAWRAFIEHPIAGVGLDRFHTETERAFEEGRLTSMYREIDPHATLPGRLAETGLIGGLTLLWLWFVWGGMAVNGASQSTIGVAAAAALAGLIVAGINADIMNFRFLWVIAGLLRGLQDAKGIAIASGRVVTATAGTD